MTLPVPLVEQALTHLREARRLLTEARAPRAADRTRAALRSAEGALRHAHRRQSTAVAPTPLFDAMEATHG